MRLPQTPSRVGPRAALALGLTRPCVGLLLALLMVPGIGARAKAEDSIRAEDSFRFEFDRFDGLHSSYRDGWKKDDASSGSEGLNVATQRAGAMLTKTARIPRAGRYYLYLVARDRNTIETLGVDDQIFRCDLRQLKPGSDQWAKFPANLTPTELEARDYEITLLHVSNPDNVIALVDYLLFEPADRPSRPTAPPMEKKLPDLAPLKGSVTCKGSAGQEVEQVSEGELLTLTAQVVNYGKGSSQPVTARFVEFVDGDKKALGDPVAVPALSPGDKHEISYSGPLPPGPHKLGIETDPSDELGEEDEKNNDSEPLKVVVLELPQWQRVLNAARTRWKEADARTRLGCVGAAAALPLLCLLLRLPRRRRGRKPPQVRYVGLGCHQCGSDLEPNAKVCSECGTWLSGSPPPANRNQPATGAGDGETCPRCHSRPEPGDRVCTQCGASLPTNIAAPAAAGPPSLLACPACGAVGEPEDRFCQTCGAPVEREMPPVDETTTPLAPACSACGKPLDPSRPFCTQCGAKVAPEGEGEEVQPTPAS